MNQRIFFLALFAFASVALVRAATRQLDAKDFHEVLDPLPAAFVMAMAPWCGHCVAAKPAFEAVDVSEVPTFMVDASTPEAESVRAHIGLRGFPTFVYLEHGRVVEGYAGDRTTPAFEAYLSAKAANAKTPTESARDSEVESAKETEAESAQGSEADSAKGTEDKSAQESEAEL
jgi:thiol-disulfide isomerase/thioredoxin